jgi:hypothetical protein
VTGQLTLPGQREVEPRFKDSKWVCKYNSTTCRRSRPCRQCLGATSAKKGRRFQSEVLKRVEILTDSIANRFKSARGHEENWNGLPWRIECKYGAQVSPAVTAYEKARAQSDAAHGTGDTRPFVNVVSKANSPIIVQVAIDDLPQLLEATATWE